MKYVKPKCYCGHELIFDEEVVYQVDSRINNNGKKSNKENITPMHTHSQRLTCKECFNYYDFSYDDKKRIIRGELL